MDSASCVGRARLLTAVFMLVGFGGLTLSDGANAYAQVVPSEAASSAESALPPGGPDAPSAPSTPAPKPVEGEEEAGEGEPQSALGWWWNHTTAVPIVLYGPETI